jgi:glycosyltransferase involved in cell wall biosynthesis
MMYPIVLRILWFNWRDIKHPESGGAEIYTHQILTRLARKGHSVTLFTTKTEGSLTSEEIDGVLIIRHGGKYSVYRRAKQYFENYRSSYDLIIDEINGRPFLSPQIVNDRPVIAIFHQLIKEEWFYEIPFPINYFCYHVMEKRWLIPYKDTQTITVSNSSLSDLESLGFTKVNVIQNGLDIDPLPKVSEKEVQPTICFIGRLRRHKLANHAIEAFKIIKNKIPDAKMWLIGDGPMRPYLQERAGSDVQFFGHVPNILKYDLLRRAQMVLVPSVREGWGLVVIEANAMGTPVIGYDIPGLRDSILNGETGILTKHPSPSSLAESAFRLLTNDEMLERYSRNALSYSRKFSWEESAERFNDLILSSLS